MFDSGVGGLTVARSIMDQLPNEEILYVADSAHGPYGPKSIAEVRARSLQIMDWLVAQNVSCIVIACNTASAAVLRDARERYSIPVIEVIQPAARRAASSTKNKRIGVIGTIATINSGAYQDAFLTSDIEVVPMACPRFVDYVEAGITTGDEILSTAHEYLDELRSANIDTLILGCTHYPLLTGVIQFVMGDDVTLVSSAEETAKDVYQLMQTHNLLRTSSSKPHHRFIATGSTKGFELLGVRILGTEVQAEQLSIGDV
jgi:glutamate racemase